MISLGAQVGGRDADGATSNHVLSLRKLLTTDCLGPYSAVIDELGIVLRIDGSIQSWGRSGVDNVFIRTTRRIATADIYVPCEVWAREDAGEYFCKFLSDNVRDAIEAIVRQALKKKIEIQRDDLLHDVDLAMSKFLGANDGSCINGETARPLGLQASPLKVG